MVEVRDAFVGALRESEDRLRVLLCIEADDLRTLRWERLAAPIDGGNWGVLAQDQRTPFSLHIPSMTDRRFPPIGRRDLRALLLVASPKDSDAYNLAPFDVAATVAGVRSALGDIPCDVLATIAGAIGSPGLDELCARLTDRSRQYTLLHVVCHGKVIEGGRDGRLLGECRQSNRTGDGNRPGGAPRPGLRPARPAALCLSLYLRERQCGSGRGARRLGAAPGARDWACRRCWR